MAKRVLYIDPWTGISGDMLLGALLDLGGAKESLATLIKDTASTLGLPDGLVEVTRGVQKGVSCARVVVRAEDAPPLRHLADMEKMIQGADLSSWVKERSLAALRRLAEVEASIHGCTVEEIHFHEVGAADTLVDVVGTFVLVEALGIDSVVIGPIQVGGGTVEIAHGLMGVPAPATARLLSGYPVVGGPEMRELTTPTGALLVGQLQAQPGPLPAMTVQVIGYGGGSMRLDCGPNVLRVVLGEQSAPQIQTATDGRTENVVELQTNLDDISPEVVAHTGRLLRGAGALDVWTSLGQGKKDRPVMVLHVLAGPDNEAALADLVFSETGTLGIRRIAMSRRVAERGHVTVEVSGRPLRVKWGALGRTDSQCGSRVRRSGSRRGRRRRPSARGDGRRAGGRQEASRRAAMSETAGRKPEWLKKRLPDAGAVQRMESLLRQRHLHTVCESALCPNLGECFGAGVATFLIMGDVCTRDCGFCGVAGGRPAPLDPDEPSQLADAAARLELKHVVVTSVTRDDLPDGGAAHYVATIRAIRERAPGVTVEVLVPDFRGDTGCLDLLLAEAPEVFNHNLETVPRLYPQVRPAAVYERSLAVLGRAAQSRQSLVKTGWMLGLGESDEEVRTLLDEVAAIGVRLVTIGQYLRPSKRQLPGGRVRSSRSLRVVWALRGGPGPAGAVGSVRA